MMKPKTTVLLTVSLLTACTPAVSPLTEQNPSTTTASRLLDRTALLQRPLSIAPAVQASSQQYTPWLQWLERDGYV